MGPHTMAPGGKRIRSDGGQARPPWAKGPRVLHTAVAQGDGGGQDAGQRSARLPSRQRDAPSPGHDPGMWPIALRRDSAALNGVATAQIVPLRRA